MAEYGIGQNNFGQYSHNGIASSGAVQKFGNDSVVQKSVKTIIWLIWRNYDIFE